MPRQYFKKIQHTSCGCIIFIFNDLKDNQGKLQTTKKETNSIRKMGDITQDEVPSNREIPMLGRSIQIVQIQKTLACGNSALSCSRHWQVSHAAHVVVL